ncbi:2-dehydropantoate 2-reductase [Iocasia frigidifontis]|uniref:2-dehydropantoate 2-reductase n=2 Tax=Iocasia fonsfrigidae TaxID=2682810 RepID=A0A8A7K4D6_9FIRM|nr:2-dehydropantoate 2-reductase [Iocasia fonsfrigidae]
MMKIKKVSLIGLGAIGAAYGSKLNEVESISLKVIASKDRIERYSKQGFDVNGKKYNFDFISPEEDIEPADLILVSVKYHHLKHTIEDMRKHVGPNTIILSLLNGISSEEILGNEYGMRKMLYAMCVAIDAVREGTNIKFSNIGKIVFGEKDNTYSENVLAVEELFDKAEIPYEIPENIMRSLWWKFMVNVGINQVSAVLRAPYGVFQKSNKALGLIKNSMEEVIEISKKIGINLEIKDIDEFINIMMELSPNGKTSMCQDIEGGRKTEVDMFAGTIYKLGLEHGVNTPVNKMLYDMIKVLEQMDEIKKYT